MRPQERPAPSDERRPASAAREPSPAPPLDDFQSLLAAATRRLVEGGAGERAVAWARHRDGAPYVVAACYEGDAPEAPEAAEFAALAALTQAATLDATEATESLRALAQRHGCALAAPVRAGAEAEAEAVLLLGGDARPRALATLDAAARRLAAPASAALALSRLAQLDAEVRELDRLAALGRLAGEIVHEVRNPLVSIKTFLQLLPERRDDPELLDEFLEVVGGELRRMERLLDLVMDQARPGRGPGREWRSGENASAASSPGEVLEATAELLRHHALARGVELAVEAPAELPRAAIGEDALRQVALNLALNALDATPHGGRVRLRARTQDGEIAIEVHDSGPGIPEPLRRAVFEPFFSTRGGRGGGLGLAIARRLVEEAGGAIGIEDAGAGGALFRIRLPALADGGG